MNDLENEIRDYYGKKALSEKQIDVILARSRTASGRFAMGFVSGMVAAAVLIIEPLVHPAPNFSPKSVQVAPADTIRNARKKAPVQVAVEPTDQPRKPDSAHKPDTLQANAPSENPAKKDGFPKRKEKRAPPPEPGFSGSDRPVQSYGIAPQNH